MELTELENTHDAVDVSLSRIPSSVNHRDGRHGHRAEDTQSDHESNQGETRGV